MDNEAEVTRQQMQDTRTSLQDKLETLEQQVKDTVQGATDAVSNTVETVRDTVKDTVGTVRDTVEDTLASVKETFDVRKHVRRHPWSAFACATLVGFLGTHLLRRAGVFDQRAFAAAPAAPAVLGVAPALHRNGNASASVAPGSPPDTGRSWWNWLTDHYATEVDKFKGLAITTAGGIVREMLTANVSVTIGERIKEVVDGITTKLGGQPIQGPMLQPSPGATEAHAGSEHSSGPSRERLVAVGQKQAPFAGREKPRA
jgi:ElaB/YqjD/DUF883 family membrane-anchored ribosome-binding protein